MTLKDLVIQPPIIRVLRAMKEDGLTTTAQIAERTKLPIDVVETAIQEGLAQGLIGKS